MHEYLFYDKIDISVWMYRFFVLIFSVTNLFQCKFYLYPTKLISNRFKELAA